MKARMIFLVVILLSLSLTVFACGSSVIAPSPAPSPSPLVAVTVNPADFCPAKDVETFHLIYTAQFGAMWDLEQQIGDPEVTAQTTLAGIQDLRLKVTNTAYPPCLIKAQQHRLNALDYLEQSTRHVMAGETTQSKKDSSRALDEMNAGSSVLDLLGQCSPTCQPGFDVNLP